MLKSRYSEPCIGKLSNRLKSSLNVRSPVRKLLNKLSYMFISNTADLIPAILPVNDINNIDIIYFASIQNFIKVAKVYRDITNAI